jgi:tetrahedral aminopeptidase
MKSWLIAGLIVLSFAAGPLAPPLRAQSETRKEYVDFLKLMLENPNPAGIGTPVQKQWAVYTSKFADNVSFDIEGNAVGVVNGKGSPGVMFAGRCNEVGYVVTDIDRKGYLLFKSLSGFDEMLSPERRVIVHTKKKDIQGVLQATLTIKDIVDSTKVFPIASLYIDIGVKDRNEAVALVTQGDTVTMTYEFIELRTGICMARAFSDRVGAFVVAETLRGLSESRGLKASIFGVSSVRHRPDSPSPRTGTFGVAPKVGIAVGVIEAPLPPTNKNIVLPFVIGGGPVIRRPPAVNPNVYALLIATAKKMKIPYQLEPGAQVDESDSDAAVLSGAKIPFGVVSIPLRYKKTPVETLSIGDIENTIKLLTAFAKAVTPQTTM